MKSRQPSVMPIRKVSVAAGNATSRSASVSSAAGRRTTMNLTKGKKKDKKDKGIISMDDIVINPDLIYSLREIWSPLNPLWLRYPVYGPRLPNENDEKSRWVDLSANSPTSFTSFIGKHNDEFFHLLNHHFSVYENTFNLPEIIVIAGPSGSGKTSIMKIFLRKLIDEQSLSNNQSNKWFLWINAIDYINDISVLWNKINRFSETNFEKFLSSKFRLIIIDNFQYISPSNQQSLKKLYLSHIGRLRYLLITPDPKQTIISFFLSKSVVLRSYAIAERDALSVVLSICYRNKIGYELEGIKAAFDLHNKVNETTTSSTLKGAITTAANLALKKEADTSLQYMNVNKDQISLSLLIDCIQNVFLQSSFISKENVFKVLNKPLELPVLSPRAAVEPLERCSICTLFPPCRHISIEEINELGIERRAELPFRGKGSLICPEFRRYGRCSRFNEYGHCSLHHPKKLHTLEKVIIRCSQCTIIWPCNHCSYTSYLTALQSLIDEIKHRMGKLRQINVPDPPISLIRHLEYIPHWKEEIARIERIYIKPTNLATLKETQEWLLTSYCTQPELYEQKTKYLIDSFRDLVFTEILNANRNHNANNNNNNLSSSASSSSSVSSLGGGSHGSAAK
jgi:DNA polymerase III delta prime subunit